MKLYTLQFKGIKFSRFLLNFENYYINDPNNLSKNDIYKIFLAEFDRFNGYIFGNLYHSKLSIENFKFEDGKYYFQIRYIANETSNYFAANSINFTPRLVYYKKNLELTISEQSYKELEKVLYAQYLTSQNPLKRDLAKLINNDEENLFS